MRDLAHDFDPVAAILQQLHQSVVSEALPDDFLQLIDAIDAHLADAQAGEAP